MFIIRNIGGSDVVIEDLRLVLGPGKEIDVDKVVARHISEHSGRLRMHVDQKRIKIVAKDLEGLIAKSMEKNHLLEMESRLKQEMSKKDQQITELTNAVKMLVTQLKEGAQQVQQTPTVSGGVNVSSSSESNISDDILSKIHAKSMNRMEQKVTGHIEQEAKTCKDDNIAQTIADLENLNL
jgi:hypothetical protein